MGERSTNPATRRSATSELLPGLMSLLVGSIAPSTRRTYTRAQQVLVDFLSQFGFCEVLPIPPIIIAMFVAHLHKCSYAASTVLTYMSAVSFLHKLHNVPDPVHTFIVQKAVAGVQKAHPQFDLRLPTTLPILRGDYRCSRSLFPDGVSKGHVQKHVFAGLFCILTSGRVKCFK